MWPHVAACGRMWPHVADLGALEQQRGVLQHARVARVLNDEDDGSEEQPEDDGVEHAQHGGERDMDNHQRELPLGKVGPRLPDT